MAKTNPKKLNHIADGTSLVAICGVEVNRKKSINPKHDACTVCVEFHLEDYRALAIRYNDAVDRGNTMADRLNAIELITDPNIPFTFNKGDNHGEGPEAAH